MDSKSLIKLAEKSYKGDCDKISYKKGFIDGWASKRDSLLEDLRCELMEVISVGEFEEIEINQLFQSYLDKAI